MYRVQVPRYFCFVSCPPQLDVNSFCKLINITIFCVGWRAEGIFLHYKKVEFFLKEGQLCKMYFATCDNDFSNYGKCSGYIPLFSHFRKMSIVYCLNFTTTMQWIQKEVQILYFWELDFNYHCSQQKVTCYCF